MSWLPLLVAFIAGGFCSIWALAIAAYVVTKRKAKAQQSALIHPPIALDCPQPRRRNPDELICIQRMPNWRQ